MKTLFKRSSAILLALALCVSLLSGLTLTTSAATVNYVTGSDGWIYNWGERGTVATFMSPNAETFYENNGVTYAELSSYSGASSTSSVPSSALYAQLKSLMSSNHDYVNGYDATKEMYAYTDCQNSGGAISSFYSGKSIGPSWDGSWNREHTWPNSKGLGGSDENDIMMLRPTSTSENSDRGNTAYGPNYYDPNSESGGSLNLHGDVARICLYVYVRWGNTSYMWGSSGVMESLDVLLEWMEEDPVDTWELGRNDAVESITGTRNVFVDYPELGFLLFNESVPAGYQSPSGEGAASAYTVTATSSNTAQGTVSVSGNTITATPATGYYASGYTVVSGSATVAQSGNTFRVSASSDCTIRINFAAKTAVTVSYSENGTVATSATVYAGDEFTLPSLTNAAPDGYSFLGWVTAALTETADKPATILSVGDTVTATGNTTYYALYSRSADGSGSGTGDYVKVTETPTDWSGDYVIVYEDGSVIFDGSLTTLDAVSNTQSVTITNSTITAAQGDPYKFTISAVTGGYAIQGIGGKYIGQGSDTNGLTASDSALVNTLSLDSSGSANIVGSGGAYLRYNSASNQNRFRYYKSSTYTGQQAIALYRKDGSGGTALYTTTTCDHTAGTTAVDAVEPTCTESGYTAGEICNSCGTYVSGHEVVDALGHSYEGVVTAPTATAQGYTTYTCPVCGDSYVSDYTDALGETYTVSFSVPAGVTAPSAMACNTKTGITLPTVGVPSGEYTYTFLGWVADEYNNVTDKPTTIYDAGSTYTATADITLRALYTYNVETEEEGGSGSGDGQNIVFELGTDGSASHSDGSSATSYTETVDEYTLTLTATQQFYTGGCDATGNSAIKLGSGSKVGGFTFTVPDDVTSVIIQAAKYKANTAVLSVNDTTYTLSGASNDGEYDSITVDTSTTKTVTVTTTSSGKRAMINSITYVVAGSGGTTTVTTAYYTTVTCDHENTTEVAGQDATCITEGYTAGVQCTDCGNYVSGHETIPVNDNHENTTDVAATSPTCTESGYTAGVYCNDCQTYVSGHEESAALGHSYNAVVTAPTATTQGYTTYTCPVCGDSYVGDYTDALGETFTVSFSAPAGVTVPSNISCNSKTGTTLPDMPTAGKTVTVDGRVHTFLGWVVDEYDNVTDKPTTIYTAGNTFVPAENTTLRALYTYDVTEEKEVPVEGVTGGTNIVFDFGENDSSQDHNDGTSLSSGATFTSGDYTLTLENVSKVYGTNAYDEQGNAVLKLGTASVAGSFSITLPEELNVTAVIFKVANYKDNTNAKVTINETVYAIEAEYNSHDGLYQTITVDTTATNTIDFAVTTNYRVMIDSITYVSGGTVGGTTTETVTTAYYTTVINGIAKFIGATVTLTDLLHLNFYAALSADYVDISRLSVQFSYVDRYGNTVTKTVPLDTATYNATYGGYLFTVELVAAYMAVDVNARLLWDGELVRESTEDSITELDYSIRDYGMKLLSGTYTDAVKATAKAMLNYGAWAQNYFGVFTDDLANAEMTDADKLTDTDTALAQIDNIGQYAATITNKSSNFIGYSLFLKDGTSLRLYFTEAVTVTIDGVEQTAVEDDNNAGRYHVDIPAVNAANLGATHTVVCGDMTISNLSVLTPAAIAAQNTGKSTNFRNAMIALILYAQSVQAL